MLPLESLNSDARPETTLDQVVEDMVNHGAELILTTSADFEVDTTSVAALYPDVTFINVSGDDALWGIATDNLGNFMGQMEYGKMIAGCAAALKTQTGSSRLSRPAASILRRPAWSTRPISARVTATRTIAA